jgi:AcrR family transcriptional regulator
MQEPGAPGATIRRRGADLLRAIYLATLTELAETSFEELGFDRIAARAGTGKTSLYRRWNSTVELVLDALTDPASGFAEPVVPDTGTLRSDLIEALRDFASALQLPHGQALRPLMTQRPRHPELYAEVLRRVVRPRMVAVLAVR